MAQITELKVGAMPGGLYGLARDYTGKPQEVPDPITVSPRQEDLRLARTVLK